MLPSQLAKSVAVKTAPWKLVPLARLLRKRIYVFWNQPRVDGVKPLGTQQRYNSNPVVNNTNSKSNHHSEGKPDFNPGSKGHSNRDGFSSPGLKSESKDDVKYMLVRVLIYYALYHYMVGRFRNSKLRKAKKEWDLRMEFGSAKSSQWNWETGKLEPWKIGDEDDLGIVQRINRGKWGLIWQRAVEMEREEKERNRKG